LAEEIISQVESEKVGISEDRVIQKTKSKSQESTIETPFLQMVLMRLWNEERERGSHKLRLSTFKELGEAENIVRAHLNKVMSNLSENERDIAVSVFRFLVTPSGTKIAYKIVDLASTNFTGRNEAELTPVLQKLTQSDMRILRSVNVPGQPTYYEIFHDVLAPAILDYRARYVKAQELAEAQKQTAEYERGIAHQRELEQNKILEEERQRRIRQMRWGVVGLAMLIIMIGAFSVALYARSVAEKQKQIALDAQHDAEIQKQIAEDQKKIVEATNKQLEAVKKELADAVLGKRSNAVINIAKNVQYEIGLYSFNPILMKYTQLSDYLAKQGYRFRNNLILDEKPYWLADRSTIFYYDEESGIKAKEIADDIEKLIGVNFDIKIGYGTGVPEGEERKIILNIHYIGAEPAQPGPESLQ